MVAIHLGTGTNNHGEIKRRRISGITQVGPMKCIRGCTATVVWISLALLMSACSSGFDFQSPAAVSPPPQQPQVVPAQSAAAHAVDSATPGGVRAEIIRWFSRAGYQSIQIEALAEHAGIESGFRPCASNGSNLRYTFQWSGARLRRLDEFAGARGSCPPLEKQLAFAHNELRNEPSYSCFWRATTKSAALAALRRGFGGGTC